MNLLAMAAEQMEALPSSKSALALSAPRSLREAEVRDQVQERVHGEAVELLRTEDELASEEGPDRRVRDAGEEGGEILGAVDHGRTKVSGEKVSGSLHNLTPQPLH